MRVSQVCLLRLVRMAPWVVGDETIGATVSGIGAGGRALMIMLIQNHRTARQSASHHKSFRNRSAFRI